MITSSVGTVLKHKTGAIAIITKVDGTRAWGVYSDLDCKDKFKWCVDKAIHTELSKEGWVAVTTYNELTKEQIEAYNQCMSLLAITSTKTIVKQLKHLSKPSAEDCNNRSDGSTASYYQLPEGAKELQDLISHRNMNAQLGEIFRACYRFGMASHSDQLRDAKKIKFYIEAEIKRLEANG